MRHSALVTFFVILIALSGCEKKASSAPPVAPPPVTAEVKAADELATFDVPIKGIAFWTHPTLPFNGLVLVATSKGVTALNIENGDKVSQIAGVDAEGVSVAYTGYGRDAQGYAAVATGGDAPGINLYAIDNASRALTPVSSPPIPLGEKSSGICLGRDEPGTGLILHIMHATGWSMIPISVKDGAASLGSKKSAAFGGGALNCVADDLDMSFFATAPGGAIARVDKTGLAGGQPFAQTPIGSPAGIGLALHGLVEGGPTDECCGEVLVLNGDDGSIYVYDQDDGHAVGAVTMTSSFDVKGVPKATAIGVGSGNFGGVYRDGVVALGTDGGKPALRLMPLNGVLDALGAKFGATADRRTLNPHEEEAGSNLNIPAPEPQNP